MDNKKKTTLDKLKLMKAAIGIGAVLSTSSCGQYKTSENSDSVGITSEQVTEDATLAEVILETLAPETETVSNTTTTAVKEEVVSKQSTSNKKVSTTTSKVEGTTSAKASSQSQKPSNNGSSNNNYGSSNQAQHSNNNSSSNNGSSNNNSEPSREETPVVTTKATSKKNPVVTTKATTKKKPVTTKKATSKPTPVKTQPVTDAPTVPPVIYEPEEYTLDMIKDNPDAFYHFAWCLNWDILQGNGVPCSYADATFGGRESCVALAVMNDGEISNSVLEQVFADYSKEELAYGIEYLYSLCAKRMMFGTDVDYSTYVCDSEVSTFLTEMDDVYRNGNIDDFMKEKFIDCDNISEKCLSHFGILSIGCSYDVNCVALRYLFMDDVSMNGYVDNLYEKVHGKSYIR